MENNKKINLLSEIYHTFYDNTNSFEQLGEHLSYLLGAVINDDQYVFFTDDKNQKEFMEFLNEHFPKDHAIHKYVIVDEG